MIVFGNSQAINPRVITCCKQPCGTDPNILVGVTIKTTDMKIFNANILRDYSPPIGILPEIYL